MKKFLAIILCFIYVAASSGATINFHYCMGKFIGFDVNAANVTNCSNCGMGKVQKKGCCDDKHETLRLKKDQLASNINDVPRNNFVYIYPQYSSLLNSYSISSYNAVQLIHSPPLIQAVSGFIFHCVFRI